jgi:hypothetical protein
MIYLTEKMDIQQKIPFAKRCKERERAGMFCSMLQNAQRVGKAPQRAAECSTECPKIPGCTYLAIVPKLLLCLAS